MDAVRSPARPGTAPTTYQEWLDCFSYVKAHPADYIELRRLRGGRLACDPYILDKFLQRLDETVGEVLNRGISAFLSRVGEAFEEGDFDGAEILASRFWKMAAESFFFEDLDCISPEQRETLRSGYLRQLGQFWEQFLAHLEREAEESRQDALDELVFRLRRLDPARIRKGMRG